MSGDASRTVRIGWVEDIDGVNELIAAPRSANRMIHNLLFLSLFDEQPNFPQQPPTFKPRLAESYEWSEDRKTLTVRLRDDVKWSDGVPVTAHDVRFTWQAQRHPAVAWDFPGKEQISQVEVVDSRTARLRFEEVYSTQLFDANEGYVLPKHAWEKLPFEEWRGNGDWFLSHLVTSGPYRLESRQPEEEIVLAANPGYSGRPPVIPRVVFAVVPDSAELGEQLLRGEVDLIDVVEPSQWAQVEASPDVELVSFPSRRYHGITWNLARPWFNEPQVRLALTLALDRQGIMDAVWQGRAEAISSCFSGTWAAHPELEPWPCDREKARAILERHGWPVGADGIRERGGERFSFVMSAAPAQNRIAAMSRIRSQLREVGVEVQPDPSDEASFDDRALRREHDAAYLNFSADTTLTFTELFHSAGAYNCSRYANPKVDTLLAAMRRQGDPLPNRYRLQEVLHEEQPVTWLWKPTRLAGVAKRLRGFRPNPATDFLNVEQWSLR